MVFSELCYDLKKYFRQKFGKNSRFFAQITASLFKRWFSRKTPKIMVITSTPATSIHTIKSCA
jgi:hypothetical protein